MQRSNLRPLRTRRVAATATTSNAATPARPAALAQISPATRRTLGALGALCLSFAATASLAGSPAENAPALSSAQAADAKLTRGRYLVENVGLCADCHSPRNEKGQFLRDQWLKGAPIAFAPSVPMPWSPAAPPLAGLPSMTEEQAIAFLRTGKRPDGSAPRPPMPEYRFSAEDAAAAVAYLKSLAK
jgi:mono/diheme cytochrome c family protein